jgi:hypothetical protein
MSHHMPSPVRLQDAFLRLGASQCAANDEPAPSGNVPPEAAPAHREQLADNGPKFRAGLEVDQFGPAPIVSQLLEAVLPILTGCLRQVRQKVPEGVRVIGLIAPEKGHGCTTTTLLLAYRLAKEGRSVLVIDASPDRQLADSLSLDIESGWEQTMMRRRPLREVIIHSHGDGFDVLPGQASAVAMQVGTKPVDWSEILAAYDWILIDFGHSFSRTGCSTNPGDYSVSQCNGGDSSISSSLPSSPFASLCSSFIVIQRYDGEATRFTLPVGVGEILGVIETFVQPRAGSQVLAAPREAA